MGKSFTPKYVAIIDGNIDICWDVKRHGAANAANLQKLVEAYGASMKPGGVNAHLGENYPNRAILRYNRAGGEIVARWNAPMFMVW